MQGEPKWFNTRDDVMNWQAECEAQGKPEAFLASLQRLYDTRLIWGNNQALEEGVSGVTDESHRIIDSMDEITGEPVRIQQELIVDPNAWIFTRLGFSDGEVKAMLEN